MSQIPAYILTDISSCVRQKQRGHDGLHPPYPAHDQITEILVPKYPSKLPPPLQVHSHHHPPSSKSYHLSPGLLHDLLTDLTSVWNPSNIIVIQQPDLTSSDCISKHKAQYVSSLMKSLNSCLLQLSWNPEPQNGLQGPAWSSFPQSHLRTHFPFSLYITLSDFQKNAKYFLIFSLLYLGKKISFLEKTLKF